MASSHTLPVSGTDRPSRLRPLAAALLLGLSGACSLGAAQAQPAVAARSYQVASGPLDEALASFAAQAGVSILIAPDLVRGLRSAGLQGAHGVGDGFARLLAGTSLQAVAGEGGSYVLRMVPRASGAAVLDEVRVTASAETEQALGPVAGHVARRSSTGSKTDALLVELPQSVSVITRERMADLGVQHMGESMRYLANVRPDSGGAQNAATNVYIRGFQSADFYVDGLRYRPLGFFGMMAEEPYGYERVEVFKGPVSGLYGQSNPGGIVNMVSKRPTEQARGDLEFSTGTGGRAQVAADVSGPASADGTLLYRFVALGRQADAYMDHQKDDRVYLAPSLSWKPDARTRLDLRAVYQKNWALATTNVPWAAVNGSSAYGRMPMDRFLGEPGFDRESQAQKSIAYDFSHDFGTGWSLRQNLRYADFDNRENYLARASGLVNGTQLLRNYQLRHAYGSVLSLDTHAVGQLQSGALRHELLAGLDYNRNRTVRDEKWGTGPVLANVFNPRYGQAVDTRAHTSWVNDGNHTQQLGAYLQDRIHWQRWVFTAGLRHDKVSTEVTDRWTGSVRSDDDWSATTGRAGVNYVFDNGFAPYAGYAQSFTPVSGATSPARGGTPFEPERGRQFEVGVKYQPPGQQSFVSLALFDLRRQNVATPDPEDDRYSVQTGETRSRGLELEASLQLRRDLRLIGAYSYNDVQVTRDNASTSGYTVLGKGLFKAPAHMASLWVDQAFTQGVLQGLNLGLGVRYTGSAWGDALNTFRVPGYTLLDLALRYDLAQASPAWRGWSASLHVRNLTDRYYVASCFFALACNMGEGRTAVARLNYQW